MAVPSLICILLSVLVGLVGPVGPFSVEKEQLSPEKLVQVGVAQLLTLQEPDGDWPYEGVYRVNGEIPVGYRIGGTAIVASALLHGAPAESPGVHDAIEKGVQFILEHLKHQLMTPSTEDRYDVRVWGHTYALNFFCDLMSTKRAGKNAAEIESWIPTLADTLVTQQLEDGGWNYATRKRHAAFVTAPAVQALMKARAHGVEISGSVFEKARACLENSRTPDGAFHYSGTSNAQRGKSTRSILPGSIARSCVSEVTLRLLGGGSEAAVQASLDAFHAHWDELEKRRKKTGTHKPPYGVAPYYFYYGHRYAAQAIQFLPAEKRAAERDRLLEVIMRTRDEDGTWNDRIFPRSRNFGTAMIVLALLGDRVPKAPGLTP